MLVYHNDDAQYEGETAADIVRALHRQSAKVNPRSYEEWWSYQKETWEARLLGVTILNHDKPQAAQKLLDILVEADALVVGPQAIPPAQKKTPNPTVKCSFG